VFIDQQPQMTFGVASADRATLINNTTLLARVAKEFNVPTVLTAVETESFSGYIWPQLLDIFPGQPVVERTSMNSWDDPGFRKAIEATGRKNILNGGPREFFKAWAATANTSWTNPATFGRAVLLAADPAPPTLTISIRDVQIDKSVAPVPARLVPD